MPSRNEAASGSGSDSTSFSFTASIASSGALGKNRLITSIVWSRNEVCWSQLTVEALNGGA